MSERWRGKTPRQISEDIVGNNQDIVAEIAEALEFARAEEALVVQAYIVAGGGWRWEMLNEEAREERRRAWRATAAAGAANPRR